MSPRDADHATGSTLVTLAAVVCVTAGALAWTSVAGAIALLVLALLLALGGGWFWRTDKHEAGRARGPWRRYPHALDRAARLRDSDAPVSHARRIDQATRGAR